MDQATSAGKSWHHAPVHIFNPNLAYIVTSGTLHQEHHFRSRERLDLLQSTLFDQAGKFEWELHAWAIFSNHYHFVAAAKSDEKNLKRMLQAIHSITAIAVNRMDETPGRQVWHDYWDTALTNEKSYFARLHYVMKNPDKHGLAQGSIHYPFCSYRWFCEKASKSTQRTVFSFPCDDISINDDFGRSSANE